MAAPPSLYGTLLDLVGPFLFPVVLFVLGLVGYGLLVALGRLGVLDAGPERDDPEDAVGEGRDGGEARHGRSRWE